MEISAVLANVGIILAKDLLADERINTNTVQHFLYDFEEDDADEAEDFFLQMQAVSSSRNNLKRDHHKNDINVPRTRLQSNINLCEYLCDEKDFRRNLHMEQKTFTDIFHKISDLLSKNKSTAFKKSGTASPLTCFSLAIWKLCTDEHFEQIAKRFNLTSSANGNAKKSKFKEFNLKLLDVHNSIREFWQIISENSKIFIDFPFRAEQMQEHMQIGQLAGLPPGMCGVITLKRFDVFLESSNEEVQIICQIIFNANQKILDCYLEFANDYDYESTPIYRMLEAKGGIKPSYGYLIGDNNFFTPRTYLITPFEKTETEEERAFNAVLKSILANSIWDKICHRFNALYALESKDLYEVRRVISTVCILHNICVEVGDNFAAEENQIETCATSDELNLSGLAPPSQAALERRHNLMREIIKI